MKTSFTRMKRSTLLAVALGFASLTAAAQDFRVGFVNTDRIFREANLAKAAQAKLEQEFSRREKEIQTLAGQLKTASEKFEREAPTLPETQRVECRDGKRLPSPLPSAW